VLLLDIIMPEMNGLELARQVRRQARLNDCLIIAVTGRTDRGHRLQCEEAGIDLFLIKPANLSFLQTLLTVESEYRLRSRDRAATHKSDFYEVAAKETNLPRPTQLPCHVMQATVAS
jgi:CheY-like chemotaxis protein